MCCRGEHSAIIFLSKSHSLFFLGGGFIFLFFLFYFFLFFKFYFIFKLYNIVLVLPNIEMNPPQVYSLLKAQFKLHSSSLYLLHED